MVKLKLIFFFGTENIPKRYFEIFIYCLFQEAPKVYQILSELYPKSHMWARESTCIDEEKGTLPIEASFNYFNPLQQNTFPCIFHKQETQKFHPDRYHLFWLINHIAHPVASFSSWQFHSNRRVVEQCRKSGNRGDFWDFLTRTSKWI